MDLTWTTGFWLPLESNWKHLSWPVLSLLSSAVWGYFLKHHVNDHLVSKFNCSHFLICIFSGSCGPVKLSSNTLLLRSFRRLSHFYCLSSPSLLPLHKCAHSIYGMSITAGRANSHPLLRLTHFSVIYFLYYLSPLQIQDKLHLESSPQQQEL